jgi:hypothetical protein
MLGPFGQGGSDRLAVQKSLGSFLLADLSRVHLVLTGQGFGGGGPPRQP